MQSVNGRAREQFGTIKLRFNVALEVRFKSSQVRDAEFSQELGCDVCGSPGTLRDPRDVCSEVETRGHQKAEVLEDLNMPQRHAVHLNFDRCTNTPRIFEDHDFGLGKAGWKIG